MKIIKADTIETHLSLKPNQEELTLGQRELIALTFGTELLSTMLARVHEAFTPKRKGVQVEPYFFCNMEFPRKRGFGEAFVKVLDNANVPKRVGEDWRCFY